ncbi:hypothetical protein [Actinomadura sp. SCN-SB]|uniref:hypothetical protein n=1 Tax=Actinomadura sp. SCN-SB TaxID=3373092 RepID=UPI00375098DB
MDQLDRPTANPVRSPDPLAVLHGMIRARYPMIIAAHVEKDSAKVAHDSNEPDLYVVVTYKNRGPWRVLWDGSYLRFQHLPPGVPLGRANSLAEIGDVADAVAYALGVEEL